jgi:class 3 adenylate cyclase
MRRDLPAGTVTFLFAEHRRVIRDACTAEGGPEVDRQGDAFFFAFPSAEGAASVAAAMTEALTSGPIRVRIGLHTRAPLVTERRSVRRRRRPLRRTQGAVELALTSID